MCKYGQKERKNEEIANAFTHFGLVLFLCSRGKERLRSDSGEKRDSSTHPPKLLLCIPVYRRAERVDALRAGAGTAGAAGSSFSSSFAGPSSPLTFRFRPRPPAALGATSD